MKKLLVVIAVVSASCTHTTTPVNPTTIADLVEITSVAKVNEPNGDIGRLLNLKITVVDTSKILYVKMLKQNLQTYTYWYSKDLYTVKSIIDHNAGYNEAYYTFKWYYKDGTTYTQTPIETHL